VTQMDVPGIARAHTSPQTGLILAALGIVFGDLGTSPLYTMRECFGGSLPLTPTPDNVLGILSLVFWSLTLVITVKYVVFVMRADNHGEGGILALMALVLRTGAEGTERRRRLLVIGLAGAALFYGDSMVTPAISVLSAVEGLAVAAPTLNHLIMPVTIAVLVALFVGQHFGTALVGKAFGPVMCLWFACLAVLGIGGILREPSVLLALDPQHAITFLLNHGWRGFTSLGAVVLALTGAEALYADMGHFGARVIRLSWFALVLPALLLNYFGQGALILTDPAAVQNPFFLLAPDWALYPLVAVSTLAAVIASQAVISGAFSMTRQAILLGYCPRMPIRRYENGDRIHGRIPAGEIATVSSIE
jgi:KUP system potassium uptake protein